MTDESKFPGGGDHAPEVLHQVRRDRWATSLAVIVTTVHVLAGLFVIGWYYYIVPRWKYDLDSFGIQISQRAFWLLAQSDFIVNYWYLLVIVGPTALVCDFLVMRWMGKQIGLRWVVLWGVCVATILLANVAVGNHLLHQAKAQLIEHVSIHGPSPWSKR